MDLVKKLQGFQLIAQEKLQSIICSIPGKRDLILEQQLIKPLEHVCGASWLKLKGIQRIYKFEANSVIPPAVDENVQIFMIHSRLSTFERVLRHITANAGNDTTEPADLAIKRFHVICVPACFAYYHRLLEEEGLFGFVQLHRYNWDFIHLDQGLLSLEVLNVFSSVFLHKDTSLLPAVAHSMRVLQLICGRPELILTYGEHAENVLKMVNTLFEHSNKDIKRTEEPSGDFGAMIIIDRDKDYASSLLTPAIYAGLLLEVFDSQAGEIAIVPESNKILTQKLKLFLTPKYGDDALEAQKKRSKSGGKPPVIRLNALHDEIYGENRYKHFSHASGQVRAQAKTIGLEVQKLNDMKLDEMHDYVARKLPKVTDLKAKVIRHLNASETVIEMLGTNFRKLQSLEEDILNNVSRKRLLGEIDQLLTVDGQRYNTLRLLCLLHLSAGIASEEVLLFMRNYCNYFGRQHLKVFELLARAGLLPALPVDEEKSSKSAKLLSNLPIPKFQQTEFQANANRLRLTVSSVNDDAPVSSSNAAAGGSDASGASASAACPSYVFNNLYIPLVAQLCSFLLRSTNYDDFASKLGMIDRVQLHFAANPRVSLPIGVKAFAAGVKLGETKDIFPIRKRTIFVYIIGGATYAEIAACNLVAEATGAQIVVASDSIISGADLIAAAF